MWDLAGGLPYLPITGTRSVQAMYRDYFPGQLDNVDVSQKTRAGGTVEVTFKRRIGTKGSRALRAVGGSLAAPARWCHPTKRCPGARRPATGPAARLGPRGASNLP